MRLDESTGRYQVSMNLDAVAGKTFEAMLKFGELAFFGDVPDKPLASVKETPPSRYVFDHPELDAVLAAAHEQYRDDDAGISQFGPVLTRRAYAGVMGMVKLLQSCPHPARQAPGAQVTVLMNEEGAAALPSNPGARNEALVNMIANGALRAQVTDRHGHTMFYGWTRRLASKTQIMALLTQWCGQCAMPGCHHSRFIEIHHIKEWADGGLTDIDNLIPLCSRCHALVSDRMAVIETDPANPELTWFMFANGEVFISTNCQRPERVLESESYPLDLCVRDAPLIRDEPCFDDYEADSPMAPSGVRVLREKIGRIPTTWMTGTHSRFNAPV